MGCAVAQDEGDRPLVPAGAAALGGATPDQPMTYVAVQEGGVAFGDEVTDEEYLRGPAA